MRVGLKRLTGDPKGGPQEVGRWDKERWRERKQDWDPNAAHYHVAVTAVNTQSASTANLLPSATLAICVFQGWPPTSTSPASPVSTPRHIDMLSLFGLGLGLARTSVAPAGPRAFSTTSVAQLLKSHSGAKKRFRLTGGGAVSRRGEGTGRERLRCNEEGGENLGKRRQRYPPCWLRYWHAPLVAGWGEVEG